MRSALFSPIAADSEFVGQMVETAVFAQWNNHQDDMPYYARWQSGEVDAVALGDKQTPTWAVEIKWGNKSVRHQQELNRFRNFCTKNNLDSALVTTRDIELADEANNFAYYFILASLYCYTLGQVVIETKRDIINRRKFF